MVGVVLDPPPLATCYRSSVISSLMHQGLNLSLILSAHQTQLSHWAAQGGGRISPTQESHRRLTRVCYLFCDLSQGWIMCAIRCVLKGPGKSYTLDYYWPLTPVTLCEFIVRNKPPGTELCYRCLEQKMNRTQCLDDTKGKEEWTPKGKSGVLKGKVERLTLQDFSPRAKKMQTFAPVGRQEGSAGFLIDWSICFQPQL